MGAPCLHDNSHWHDKNSTFSTTNSIQNGWFNSDIERRSSGVCEAARTQNNSNIFALAREFGLPYQRLRGRVNGREILKQRRHFPKALNEEQEAALIQWIRRSDSVGISPTYRMVEQSANEILARTDEVSAEKPARTPLKPGPKRLSKPPRIVGKKWVYRFIQRLPEDLCTCITTQKPVEKARFDVAELGVIIYWYDRLEQEIRNGQYSP